MGLRCISAVDAIHCTNCVGIVWTVSRMAAFLRGARRRHIHCIAGLIAREMGGKRWAQTVAAVSVAITPITLLSGSLFQYVAFDYLWWVLLAYLTVRLINSGDPRWWLAIGIVI